MTQISLFDFDEPAAAPVLKGAVKKAEQKKEEQDTSTPLAEQTIQEPLPTVEESNSIAIIDTAEPEILEVAATIKEEEIIELPIEVNAATKYLLQQKKKGRGRKSQKEMAATVHYVNVPDDETLFSKRYYSIGLVADMFCENISLIRFWENEFDILKPKKNGKGNRLFRPEDVKNLQIIHHLLREQKYTLDGAKDFMKRNKKQDETFKVIDELKNVKALLGELKASL